MDDNIFDLDIEDLDQIFSQEKINTANKSKKRRNSFKEDCSSKKSLNSYFSFESDFFQDFDNEYINHKSNFDNNHQNKKIKINDSNSNSDKYSNSKSKKSKSNIMINVNKSRSKSFKNIKLKTTQKINKVSEEDKKKNKLKFVLDSSFYTEIELDPNVKKIKDSLEEKDKHKQNNNYTNNKFDINDDKIIVKDIENNDNLDYVLPNKSSEVKNHFFQTFKYFLFILISSILYLTNTYFEEAFSNLSEFNLDFLVEVKEIEVKKYIFHFIDNVIEVMHKEKIKSIIIKIFDYDAIQSQFNETEINSIDNKKLNRNEFISFELNLDYNKNFLNSIDIVNHYNAIFFDFIMMIKSLLINLFEYFQYKPISDLELNLSFDLFLEISKSKNLIKIKKINLEMME